MRWIINGRYVKPNSIKNYDEYSLDGVEIEGEIIENVSRELAIPIGILNNTVGLDLPEQIHIVPCRYQTKDFIDMGDFFGQLIRIGNSLVYIFDYNESDDSRNEYDKYKNSIGLIQGFENYVNNYSFDDEQKTIYFEMMFNANMNINSILGSINNILSIIFSMGHEYQNSMSEKDFTVYYVIPALNKLEFFNVRYNHGNDEFGKDVIFQYNDEFGDRYYGGAQIKLGDISGKANADIDMIISQINDAFSIPYKKSLVEKEIYINKLLIICSGKYTSNAIEKINYKIFGKGFNVKFLDGINILNYLNN